MEGQANRSPWPPPGRPGWVWQADQHAYVWWDGQRPTTRATWDGTSLRNDSVRPLATVDAPSAPSRRTRSIVVGLLVSGGVVLAWGMTRVREKPCPAASQFTYTDPAPLWLPWLVLVLVVGLLVVASRALAADVAWVKGCAVAGVVVSGITFPVVPLLASVPNCSL